MSARESLARIHRVMAILSGHPNGLPLDAVAQELGVTESVLRREILDDEEDAERLQDALSALTPVEAGFLKTIVAELSRPEARDPALLAKQQASTLTVVEIECAIAACAEGYAFPTNLDRDPPLGGLAPASQQDLLRHALAEQWPAAQLNEALLAQADKKLA